MRTVFVIGGMGSGKSTVAQFLAGFGAAVLDLDRVGHEALREAAVRDALVRAFGDDILDEAGAVDRPALAAHAFATSAATDLLTAATQPAITAALCGWLTARRGEGIGVAVVEASAFDGAKDRYAGHADYLVAVCAPVEARVRRAVAKGFSEADVRRRIAQQPSDEDRRAWADFVIENKGSRAALKACAADLWGRINDGAAHSS
ncbi:MAG: dephospho-CoA kinase [Eggerthellaceae bacterium]|nr:dephospho-CoA kinase [Eggerthellaceae bacterium]